MKPVILLAMSFASPLFLWALATVAIPVIIHLFNFRRYTKVYFTNVRFLRELQEETKSSARLKEWLILAARCLAIICLVLAFAQPFLPAKTSAVQSGTKAVSIYLDNSFSMQNVNQEGPLLDVARQAARGIVQGYGMNDRFQVMTNDFEGRHQRLLTRDDALAVIDEIKPSPVVRKISDVLKRQTEFLRGNHQGAREVYLLTDLQKSSFNLSDVSPDTSMLTRIVPVQSPAVNNVYVDTCWFESPVQQKGFIQVLHARIRNAGNTPVESGTVKLTVNGRQSALASYSLAAGAVTEVKFTTECKTEGFNDGTVQLEDFPVTFDDQLYFSYSSRVSIPVCLISGPGSDTAPFTSLFGKDSLFQFQSFSEKNIDYGTLRKSQVVILLQPVDPGTGLFAELINFVQHGGSLVIIPGPGNTASVNNILQSVRLPACTVADTTRLRTERLESGKGFFSGVFEKMEDRMNLPLVNQHYKWALRSHDEFETLLKLENGDPLLVTTKSGDGKSYAFACPLTSSSTNFTRHALFVPVMYKIALSAVKARPLFYLAGDNVSIDVNASQVNDDKPPRLVSADRKIEVIPERRVANGNVVLMTRGQVLTPGFFRLVADTTALVPLAFNYSRLESQLACMTPDEAEKVISEKGWRHVSLFNVSGTDVVKAIQLGTGGRKLWKLFIILALIFIATEVTLLRFLK